MKKFILIFALIICSICLAESPQSLLQKSINESMDQYRECVKNSIEEEQLLDHLAGLLRRSSISNNDIVAKQIEQKRAQVKRKCAPLLDHYFVAKKNKSAIISATAFLEYLQNNLADQ